MAVEFGGSSTSGSTSSASTRKREAVEEENAELSRIREEYKRKKDEARESGEAAVSHLTSEYQRKLEHAEKSEAQKLQSAREALQAQSQNVRRAQKSFDSTLTSLQREEEGTFNQQRDQADTRLRQLNSNENRERDQLVRRDQERNQGLSEQQHQRMEALESRYQSQSQKEKQEHAAQLNRMHEIFQGDEKKVQASEQSAIKKEEERGKYEAENLKKTYDRSLGEERERENKNLNAMSVRTRDEYRKQLETSSKKLADLRHKDQASELAEQKQFAETEHKVETQYTKEQQRTIQAGEKQLHISHDHYAEELNKQKETYKAENDEIEKDHSGRIKDDDLTYEKTRERQKEAFLKSMGQEKKHFEQSFQMNQKVHQNTMVGQERLFEKDKLLHQKQNMESISEYDHYQEDPFYRMKAADARLTEHPHQYIFEAEIPAHEIKNVKITVLKDRVVLSGDRAFADEVKKGPHTVSAHNYQTFREEFALNQPVLEKNVQHEYADGTYRVVIPKLGGRKTSGSVG